MSKTCEDIKSVLACGISDLKIEDNFLNKCSEMAEAGQAELLACVKGQEVNYCKALKKGRKGDAAAATEALTILTKCVVKAAAKQAAK